MNMNSIVKNISILFLSTSLFACSDFLDVKPLDSYTGEVIFKNATLTETYVNQRYTELRHGFSQTAMRFVSDETYNNFNWQSAYLFNRGEVTPDQIGGFGVWDEYYKAIKNCNIFFENIDQLDAEKSIVDRMTGEITFLRAFFYAELVNRYGGVPLIEKTFGLNDNMMLKRSSYEECVNFIVSELDKAIALLPVNYDNVNFGRATKGAAMALKARVLLYAASPMWNTTDDKSKWKAAADAAKAVIDLSNNGVKVYELDPDYVKLFLTNKSKEIIFMRQYNSEYGHTFDWQNSPNGFTGWSATCVTQDMVDSYEMADGSMPTAELYSSDDPWAGREPRFYASIVCDGQLFRGREIEFYISSTGNKALCGKDSEYGIDDWNASKSHYTIRKFMDESLRNAWNDKGSQPWIYFRLGEMYLNYAEAVYHLGDEANARLYINKIRERARGGVSNVLPDINASGAELLAKIQHERKIELAFEDHRFFDVRRWKIAEQTENVPAHKIVIIRDDETKQKTYKIEVLQERKFLPQHYLFPIPRYEIQRNPDLEQNPYY